MKAYSLDLRERIVAAVEAHTGRQAQIAATYGVSYAFVKKLLHRWRTTASIEPLPHGGGQVARLDQPALQVLAAQVRQQPDATLAELAAHLHQHPQVGVQVSPATLTRALQKLDLRRKKNSRR
jgi:transposase